MAGPAARRLDKLSEGVAAAIIETFGVIRTNPRRVGKPLRFELEGLWSARRGPYRILYEVDDATRTVTIVALGHRADIYRSH